MDTYVTDSESSSFGRVEQVSEGYYRFHLPATADGNRVREMTELFEETVEHLSPTVYIEKVEPSRPISRP